MVLPVGKKVRILLTATDVIHTWWVPQFGVKRDAVPGFLRETWVKIEEPGVYRGQCAELCGKDTVSCRWSCAPCRNPNTPPGSKRRRANSPPPLPVPTRPGARTNCSPGQEVYEAQCAVCHQPDGKGMPQPSRRSAGSKIVTGPLLSPDGKPLKDSHVDRVLNGKEGTAMQAFRNTLNDVELAAVITYERNALGNSKGDLIQPAQIKALR